ncbi:helix-turn-helix domain-containing protein [uncultured Chryseobacterium sp.]
MYIYTEAGFTSQSTFNRVFKQLEGITPSEYMENSEKQKNSFKM